jgi:hypothetical protein
VFVTVSERFPRDVHELYRPSSRRLERDVGNLHITFRETGGEFPVDPTRQV